MKTHTNNWIIQYLLWAISASAAIMVTNAVCFLREFMIVESPKARKVDKWTVSDEYYNGQNDCYHKISAR